MVLLPRHVAVHFSEADVRLEVNYLGRVAFEDQMSEWS